MIKRREDNDLAFFISIGHKRTGSNVEIMKDDVCDVDIDIYITELTALLRLMQVMFIFSLVYHITSRLGVI